MKKSNLRLLFPMLALVFTSFSAQAQVDIKISPFSVLFNRLIVRGEFAAANNIGIEVLGGSAWNKINFDDEGDIKFSNLHIGANGRYYFNPDKGIDRFYVGAYTKYNGGSGRYTESNEKVTSTRFAVGTMFGYKAVSKGERILFDFSLGFGRALVYKIQGDTPGADINLADFPILNWDLPILVGIGYRF